MAAAFGLLFFMQVFWSQKKDMYRGGEGGGGRQGPGTGGAGPKKPLEQAAGREARKEGGGRGGGQQGVCGHCFVPLVLPAGVSQASSSERQPSAAGPSLVGILCFVCCGWWFGLLDPLGVAALPL